MKVAAIQMLSGEMLASNLERCAVLLKTAATQGARLAVLPENFALFDSAKLQRTGLCEQTIQGRIRSFVADQAKQLDLFIVAGSLPCAARPDNTLIADRIRASCFVYSPAGNEVARYDKIHLFDVLVNDAHGAYRESSYIEPGDTLALADVDEWKIGLSICYDLRFPAMFQRLSLAGAGVICVPAAFTHHTGAAHWEVLLRARAIENQTYIIAPNQGGYHSQTRETWGHSMIIDPWGTVIARMEKGEGIVTAELDMSLLKDVRHKMPVFTHLRDVDKLA